LNFLLLGFESGFATWVLVWSSSLRSGFWFRFDLDRFFDFGSWVWVLCWISYSIWILPSTVLLCLLRQRNSSALALAWSHLHQSLSQLAVLRRPRLHHNPRFPSCLLKPCRSYLNRVSKVSKSQSKSLKIIIRLGLVIPSNFQPVWCCIYTWKLAAKLAELVLDVHLYNQNSLPINYWVEILLVLIKSPSFSTNKI